MNLSAAQRKYLLRDQLLGGAVFNGPINGLFAWLTFRKTGVVPMQGLLSILNDVIGTAVLLPLGICLVGTPLIHKFIQMGKVEPIPHTPSPELTMLRWLPANSLQRALILALAALATFATAILGVLLACGVHSMSAGGYALLKFFYAGVLGALVSPVVALYAMASAPSQVAAIETTDNPLPLKE